MSKDLDTFLSSTASIAQTTSIGGQAVKKHEFLILRVVFVSCCLLCWPKREKDSAIFFQYSQNICETLLRFAVIQLQYCQFT